MKSPQQHIEERVAAAAQQLLGTAPAGTVKPCADPRHGDFQSNIAMTQAKALGKNPRELATQLAALLPEDEVSTTPTLAGPGFLNFSLKTDYLNRALAAARAEGRLGIEKIATPQTIVIDFGGPNIAKEPHVGNMRSTILGDALVRLYRFLGHRVIGDDHLGDWGTGFGKILFGYKKFGDAKLLDERPIEHLEELYQRVNEMAKADEAVQEAARRELLLLQQGDPENFALWQRFVATTRAELEKLYTRIGVVFDESLGESAYNDMLAPLVAELERKGIARRSEGAIVVFFDAPGDDPQLADKPFLIQKGDGAALYATTDLAAVQYRVEHYHPDRILYVTDGRQQLHFQQIFATVQKWGIAPNVSLEHIWFGTILGEDKKPLKAREGKPVKFRALLDEAESRAKDLIAEKRPGLSPEKQKELARVIGLGALKYADLAQNRNLDYVFNWNKLLAFDGNTAPYLQNAYVRIRSVFRKGELAPPPPETPLHLSEPSELAIAKKLLGLGETLALVVEENRPHFLCVYLHDLATAFHQFYEACPVLKAEEPIRSSRLALCAVTAEALALGLGLLGIGVVEEM